MNHSRHRAGRAGGLMQTLSEISTADQVRESFQKLAYMDGRAVKIKKTLRKNSNRDNAADQNWPHQQSAFLDVINHAEFCTSLCAPWQGTFRVWVVTLVLGFCSGINCDDLSSQTFKAWR